MIQNIRQSGWLNIGILVTVCLLFCERGHSQEARKADRERSGRAHGRVEHVTIGTVLPLTGGYAEYGQNVLAGLQIAAEDFNRSGPLQIHIIANDDQADPVQAVSALNTLRTVHGVRFVIGGFTSTCSEAMYPVAEWSGMLMFSSSTSTPSLTNDTPMFFRNWPSDRDQARTFAHQTIKLFEKKSASLLYSNSEYGVDVMEQFREAYESMGGKIVIEEPYEPKATDFQKHIQRLLENPAECVWLFGYYHEMGLFLKQAHELGLHTQFFGQEGIEGAELLQIAGEAAEGLIYFVPVFDPNDESPKVKRFVEAFKAKLGRTPDVVAAHAYDALDILARSIQAVGPDPQMVARHLLTVNSYPGVAGLTTLDENGDASKPVMVKTIKEGKFVSWGTAKAVAAQEPPELPEDLARVVAAWPTLSEPVKAGILAMVEAASPPP